MALSKAKRRENKVASTKIADKSLRMRTERKINEIINYLMSTQQYYLIEYILGNVKIQKFLGTRAINEIVERIERNREENIIPIETYTEQLGSLFNKNSKMYVELGGIPEEYQNQRTTISPDTAYDMFELKNTQDLDFSDPEIRRGYIRGLTYPRVILKPEILKFVDPYELVMMFSYYPDLERVFKQIEYEQNPMFSQEVRQLITFGADELTVDDLVDSLDEETQEVRNNHIRGMIEILKEILENFEETGKLERLINDENQRNETLNSLMPDDMQILASEGTLQGTIARIENNLNNGTLSGADKLELAVILRNFLNRCAHEQEVSLTSMLRERYNGGQTLSTNRINKRVVGMTFALKDCLTSGKRVDDKSKRPGVPIDYELLKGEGREAEQERNRLETFIKAILGKEKLRKVVDINTHKNITQKIVSALKDHPEGISDEQAVLVTFAKEMKSILQEVQRDEIDQKIERYADRVSDMERRYSKIPASLNSSDFYDFVKEVIGARKNGNRGFESRLGWTAKGKMIREVSKLLDDMEQDVDLKGTNIEDLLKEMARHSKMDRELFDTKQTVTRQIVELEQYLEENDIYIEHNSGRGVGDRSHKEDRNVIDIFIPGYTHYFGGHYDDNDFTAEEISEFEERFDSVTRDRRIAYSRRTEDYATFVPVRLTDDQVEYLGKLATAIEIIETTNKTPEDYEAENREEFVAYDLTKEDGTINVYSELYDLREQNPEEYEKVRHQILLGAGIETFRGAVIKQREKEEREDRQRSEAEARAEVESLGDDDELSSSVLVGSPQARPDAAEARKRFSAQVRSGEVADIERGLQEDHILGDTPEQPEGTGHGDDE